MVDENKKTILVIEDDRSMLDMYETVFESDYNIVPLFYEGSRTEIPTKEFDGVILDGLNGDCMNLAERIDAERKLIISGDLDIVKEATRRGLIAEGKPIELNKIRDILG